MDLFLLSEPSALFPPFHNKLICGLVFPRLVSLGRFPPRGTRMSSAGGLPLAAAQRVVHRIHSHPAHMGSFTQPSRLSCLADRDINMVRFPPLPDGRHTF